MELHIATVTNWKVGKFPKRENQDWEEEIWTAYELLCSCGVIFKGYLAQDEFRNHIDKKEETK